MIPCADLFLEIEVPDPTLNYFILNQDKINNTEHLLGRKTPGVLPTRPAKVGKGSCNNPFTRAGGDKGQLPPEMTDPPYPYFTPFDESKEIELETHCYDKLTLTRGYGELTFLFDWISCGTDEYLISIDGVEKGTALKGTPLTIQVEEKGGEGFTGVDVKIVLDADRTTEFHTQTLGRNADGWVYRGQSFFADDITTGLQDWAVWTKDITRGSLNGLNDPRLVERQMRIKCEGEYSITPYFQFADWENGWYEDFLNITPSAFTTFTWTYTESKVPQTRFWNAVYFSNGNNEGAVEWVENVVWFDGVDVETPIDPDALECELSGINTFVIEKSCLDGNVDLLEGWGSSKPDHIWVDLITDAAEIQIERGFDAGLGIVGSPIAGQLRALVMDPTLDGINSQRIALGQRFRLRARNNVVFTGVVRSMKSTHDATQTPYLEVEAVDAFGVLNAQMVGPRDYENYKARLMAATEQIGLTSLIQETTTILNPTDKAMSGLDLLKETQDSEGSVCWVDRNGTFYSTNRLWNETLEDLSLWETSPFYGDRRFTFWGGDLASWGELFFDNIDGWNTNGIWEECLASFTYTSDTRQVINGITFTNTTQEIEQGTDENGNSITEKVNVSDTFTFEDATSRRLYGDASVRLNTYLPENELVGYADYIFQHKSKPKEATEVFRFVVDRFENIVVPPTTMIEIGEPIQVNIKTNDDLIYDFRRVAKIRHEITPTEWLCEIETI